MLDETACAALVASAEAGLSSTGEHYPASYRDNDRWVKDDPGLAADLFARMRHVLPPTLVDAEGARWRLHGLNERFRFCRYRDGQRFRIHQDGAHADGLRRSQLTLQIYLGGAAELAGGRTRFYDARLGSEVESIVPERGTAIVFDHEWWHDGEAVTQGTKHIVRTDVMYVLEEAARAPEDEHTLRGHTGYVFDVCPLRDRTRVATSSRDRTVRLWNLENAGARCTAALLGHTASVHALLEPRRGGLISASRDGTVRAWDLDALTSQTLLDDRSAFLSLAEVEADLFACGGGDGAIRLVDAGGTRHRTLVGHAGWVWTLAALSDGVFASGSEDGALRLWDPGSGECGGAHSPRRGPVHAVAAIDRDTLVSGHADGHLIVHAIDRQRGDFQPLQVIAAHAGEVYDVTVLDADHVASGGEDGWARVFRWHDGTCVGEFRHGAFVRSVADLGNGVLATAGYDGVIKSWRRHAEAEITPR